MESFYKKDGVYRAPALDQFPWLGHGFGTRHSTPPEKAAILKQVHSSKVVHAEGRTGDAGEADALIDNSAGSVLAIKTADCVPILLVDPEHRAIAAVHAGWRGTAGKIVDETIRQMKRRFDTNPGGLHAAIGPGIGECCFEVGPDVALELIGKRERAHVDLAGINWNQLSKAGLNQTRIYSAGMCTVCLADEFFSYRREREQAGRMISYVQICHPAALG
ncbi:MAG: peptidoglycan editing factor PgeF [Bryobacteraceae bacterium]